ncbi:B12-binding domain-containing protein [Mangrovibacterium sp.]|uniref:cobalamin B12-binding domain-containing protein n=1 Tax=Mangrovibacterium sp. TaxID=1961364 RepID=UPI003561CBD5
MDNQLKEKEQFSKGLLESQQPHKEFLRSLLAGNHLLCSEQVQAYLGRQISIKELYENIFAKALYDVGELWEFNKITVATEHLASAIVESILNQLYFEIISNKKNSKTVVAACVENESHQIGIKMVSDVFEMNGWNALFLGANTPTSELVRFVNANKPDALAISLTIYFNLPALEKMIQRVQNEFPDLPILVGGQAFRHGGKDVVLNYDNVEFLPDLNSLELFIKNKANE